MESSLHTHSDLAMHPALLPYYSKGISLVLHSKYFLCTLLGLDLLESFLKSMFYQRIETALGLFFLYSQLH